ncbi:6-bladed beta-propeller [Penaeicola halotolerans]|uniref:6-bladed beta-propeller n=1 Tax=Penaeicola halotolerans TaxID=2793196 RepID=UPI001CF8957C|nr:6-bladed beta-propeller [Penaeicola halotolerans]
MNKLDASFDDVLNDLNIIDLKLPDTVFLGKIDNVISNDNFYILQDSEFANALYFFNKKGYFVNQLNKKGDGPEEYRALSNFVLINDTIKVYDRASRKVVKYLLPDLKFISYKNIDHYIFGTIYDENKEFILSISDEETSDVDYLGIIIHDKDFNILKNFSRAPAIIEASFTENLFIHDNNYFYSEPFNELIYKVEKDTLTPLYKIDFGSYKLPDEIVNISDPEEFYDRIRLGEYAFAIHHVNFTKNSLSFNFYRNLDFDNKLLGIYNMNTDKGGILRTENIFQEYLANPISKSGNHYYTIVYPSESETLDESLKERLKVSALNDKPLLLEYNFELKN